MEGCLLLVLRWETNPNTFSSLCSPPCVHSGLAAPTGELRSILAAPRLTPRFKIFFVHQIFSKIYFFSKFFFFRIIFFGFIIIQPFLFALFIWHIICSLLFLQNIPFFFQVFPLKNDILWLYLNPTFFALIFPQNILCPLLFLQNNTWILFLLPQILFVHYTLSQIFVFTLEVLFFHLF